MILPELEFRHPWLLWAALSALPVWLLARRAGGRVVFSSLGALPTQARSLRARLAWVPDVALALAAAALAVALAGPRMPDRTTEVRTEGIAIAMVVDISGSMIALDLSEGDEEVTRLDAVMRVFEEFVVGGRGLSGRRDDAIGLITFARYADTRAPLTLDHDILLEIARDVKIVRERHEDGTAIGDGLGLAVERLRESPARSRVAILLTDGVNNAGEISPMAAAELARQGGVRVYTVGAGTIGMAKIRLTDPLSGRSRVRMEPVEIDEPMLREIAERTGGRYYRATDADTLRSIYQAIDGLERSELTQQRQRQYREYYGAAVAVGLLFALLAWLLRGTVLRRLP